jgi:hypothetical protein
MKTKCSGEEYRLFNTEIKADRDLNAQLSFYNATIKCGNEYNDCIITECGTTFTKCLGKTAGDKAIQKCSKIAQKCTEQDSGLASRTMETFGNLRGNAEKAIVRDEKRLYELRDSMRSACSRLGAMFDERSLDCVYTVEFYAGEDNTLYASKKAYAGSTFSCTQNWFGVDITTFMENAFRLTRAQTSASSAALGAGVGTAVGAITSGAIDRAVDRAKAERALGEELCDQSDGKWQKTLNRCKCPDGTKWDDEEGCLIQDEEDVADDEEEAADQAEEAADKKDLENALTSLSEEDLKKIDEIPYNSLSNDLHNILLYDIGILRKNLENEDERMYKIGWQVSNALILMGKYGNPQTNLLDLYEAMRQDEDFFDFVIGDCPNIIIEPTLTLLAKDNLISIKNYLLEPNLWTYFKIEAIITLGIVGTIYASKRDEVLSIAGEILDIYTEAIEENIICDGTIAAFLVSIFIDLQAKEFLPKIKKLYEICKKSK